MANDGDSAEEGLASLDALPNRFGQGGLIRSGRLNAEDADEQAVRAELAGKDGFDEADRRQRWTRAVERRRQRRRFVRVGRRLPPAAPEGVVRAHEVAGRERRGERRERE